VDPVVCGVFAFLAFRELHLNFKSLEIAGFDHLAEPFDQSFQFSLFSVFEKFDDIVFNERWNTFLRSSEFQLLSFE
jgi:hypothetical protein